MPCHLCVLTRLSWSVWCEGLAHPIHIQNHPTIYNYIYIMENGTPWFNYLLLPSLCVFHVKPILGRNTGTTSPRPLQTQGEKTHAVTSRRSSSHQVFELLLEALRNAAHFEGSPAPYETIPNRELIYSEFGRFDPDSKAWKKHRRSFKWLLVTFVEKSEAIFFNIFWALRSNCIRRDLENKWSVSSAHQYRRMQCLAYMSVYVRRIA